MPLIEEFRTSSILVVAVTDFGNKLGMAIDDFFEHAELQDVSRIVVIDPLKLKGLSGLPPEYPDFWSLLAHLKKRCAEHDHQRLVITGFSGGGYTALLLGHMLKADQVVVFAPYPYLSIEMFRQMKDPTLKSMARIVNELNQLPADIKRLYDLRSVLLDWNNKTEFYVHASRYHKWDKTRALYLSGIPHMEVVLHGYDSHTITAMLRNGGDLKNCFRFPYKRSRSLRQEGLLLLKYLLGKFKSIVSRVICKVTKLLVSARS